MFSTLWVHEIQLVAWQMLLIQPIYKGGGKSKADPASYRAIYLSSALAQLFERILISWLTKFTEIHSTLMENQLRTRSGLQIYHAIYCLLSIIQYNIFQKGVATYVANCDFSTVFPCIHQEKNSCHYYVKRIMWEECANILENDCTWSRSVSSTHGLPKVAVSTSCVECLRGAGYSFWEFCGLLDSRTEREISQCYYHPKWGGQVNRWNSLRWWSVSDLDWCSRTLNDDNHMPDIEWKGEDAIQRWQN